ncbi:MAG: hypothetical protein ACNA8W_25060, partial [Bradymonadaceae bacterium]
EAVWHPRMIQEPDLAAKQKAGESLAFFDTRPPAEYAKMRVPGATVRSTSSVINSPSGARMHPWKVASSSTA